MNPLVLNVLTRRASLSTLGTAGLAAFARSSTAGANKKHGKKRGQKGDDNNLQLCKKQAGAWTTRVTTECEGDPDCLELLECATPLKSCDFSGFLACFTAGQDMSRSTARGTVRIAGPLGHAAANQNWSS